MFNKSKPFQFKNRKIVPQTCSILNDNHIIGLILIWRQLNLELIGRQFAHRGVLIITGNYKIDILKSPQQQKEEFETFKRLSFEQLGLRYFVLDYLDNSQSLIREIYFQGDIYQSQNNEFSDDSFRWSQEDKVIEIQSYISTIQQAYHLFESNAGMYSTLENNCNHMAYGFIKNYQKYEDKMRNVMEFDIKVGINKIKQQQDGELKEQYVKDCGNLVLLALQYKKFGFWNKPILKPFPLNYGQIEYLEKQYNISRVQKIYEQNDQNKINQQWQLIKIGLMEQKFMNRKHLLEEQTLPYLEAIEY